MDDLPVDEDSSFFLQWSTDESIPPEQVIQDTGEHRLPLIPQKIKTFAPPIVLK